MIWAHTVEDVPEEPPVSNLRLEYGPELLALVETSSPVPRI